MWYLGELGIGQAPDHITRLASPQYIYASAVDDPEVTAANSRKQKWFYVAWLLTLNCHLQDFGFPSSRLHVSRKTGVSMGHKRSLPSCNSNLNFQPTLQIEGRAREKGNCEQIHYYTAPKFPDSSPELIDSKAEMRRGSQT